MLWVVGWLTNSMRLLFSKILILAFHSPDDSEMFQCNVAVREPFPNSTLIISGVLGITAKTNKERYALYDAAAVLE